MAVSEARVAAATVTKQWLRWFTLERLAWLLPFAVFVFIRRFAGPDSLVTPIGGFIALAIIILVARNPVRGVLVLFAFLPYQLITLAGLYKLGVGGSVVRPLGRWRLLLVIWFEVESMKILSFEF
jgi:hypothetical protein